MLFTVAITVWRREYLLPHAIQSVINQTWRDWEMVVYGFGRSRRAERLVADLDGDLPIRYVQGRARYRTRGNNLRRMALEQARGSHVVIVGHDCLLYPTYLETMAGLVGSDSDALPVVPIDFWKEFDRRSRLPSVHPAEARIGQIDLLCYAFPRDLALAEDCFGPATIHRREADFLSFEALRRRSEPRFADGPARACHF